MEKFQRDFESTLTSDQSISGRVVKFNTPYFADGMDEVIGSDTEIEIPSHCTALLSHKKEFPIGKKNINLFFKKKDDGLYFNLKPVETSSFKEARELCKSKIISGVSPGFTAVPIYKDGQRKFKKIVINELSLTSKPCIDSSSVHARSKDLPKGKILFPPECYL